MAAFHAKAIAANLHGLAEYSAAKTVMFYAPIKQEVDTTGMISLALREKTVCLPVVRGGEIVPVEVEDESWLARGRFGIIEPRAGNPVDAKDIDVVIVPGIGFDVRGNRLGYGRGYYDRFLKTARAAKIGLAYDFQVVEALPVHDHDVRVDRIITESKIIDCRQ
jgi:5-formyltetrahydrofolate cyclo-ligase